jgi:lambda repressor-like predicted transcriptional regulator
VAAYQAGSSVYELAKRHRIDRKTVSIILERQRVPRRYRLIEGELLAEAIKAYENGDSLATLGDRMGVSPYTIRRALLGVGVTIRARPGWDLTG